MNIITGTSAAGTVHERNQLADVAVIMCPYGASTLLPRALGSVLLQKCTRWHLYLVNNGGDREALEDMLRLYRPVFGHRLSVINSDERLLPGEAAGRALGFVQEEFIVLHDDNETWDVNFLCDTINFLTDKDGIGFCGVVTDFFQVSEICEGLDVRQIERSSVRHDPGALDYISLIGGNSFPAVCFLFRRSALRSANFPEGFFPDAGDRNFICGLMAAGDIGVISQLLATHHIVTEGNISVEKQSIRDKEKFRKTLLRNGMLRESLNKDPGLRSALQIILDPVENMNREVEALRHHFDTRFREAKEQKDDGAMSGLQVQIQDLAHQQQHMLHLMQVALRDIDQIRIVSTWQKRFLMPVYWVWRAAVPVRRGIARLRGRV
ncbi:glycosyltransferase [Acetobacter fallax]|uniref:Glycosyltransferase n=1 Tax=Acetobacter fallax TaxID=1737473 RepID=A0ABX0K6Z2_9PROT|nr:glycosyltransferase [Acetobacter fallax]NHO32011.1 glycosyltransferase [Acetobacter fallax]NHO35473.1 glycosyltransferase [Acetobacter fallax]